MDGFLKLDFSRLIRTQESGKVTISTEHRSHAQLVQLVAQLQAARHREFRDFHVQLLTLVEPRVYFSQDTL